MKKTSSNLRKRRRGGTRKIYKTKNFSALENKYKKKKYLILTGEYPYITPRVRLNRLKLAKAKHKLGIFFYRNDHTYHHDHIKNIPKWMRRTKKNKKRR